MKKSVLGRAGSVGLVVFALSVTVSANVTEAAAKSVTVTSPRKGSALRTTILNAIRKHDGGNEKYVVTRLNVASQAGRSLAFFSGRPECCDGSDYLITKIGNGPWKVTWTLGRGGGSGDCSEFAKSDQRAINTITAFGLNVKTFAPELLEALAYEQQEGVGGGDCVGDSGIG